MRLLDGLPLMLFATAAAYREASCEGRSNAGHDADGRPAA